MKNFSHLFLCLDANPFFFNIVDQLLWNIKCVDTKLERLKRKDEMRQPINSVLLIFSSDLTLVICWLIHIKISWTHLKFHFFL